MIMTKYVYRTIVIRDAKPGEQRTRDYNIIFFWENLHTKIKLSPCLLPTLFCSLFEFSQKQILLNQ